MKKSNFLVLSLLGALSLISCSNPGISRVKDEREINNFEYTINNLSTVDSLGREVRIGDSRDHSKTIGMFYHVWHGTHNTPTDSIDRDYNITKLLENDPETLWNGSIHSEDFHYWGEPLYGYYNSSDPFVITRHIELLMNAGVDYLVYDLTNSVIYTKAINAIFEILDNFYQQGFNVPKVAFYTNTGSGRVIQTCYETWYKKGSYSHLWFSLNGEKPLIIGRRGEVMNLSNGAEIMNFFDIREAVWPTDSRQDLEGFPWMSWNYPQDNFNGTMSVSLAQHPGSRMSEGSESNRGRGFDYETYKHDDVNFRNGSNFQGQYETVFKANDKSDPNYDEDFAVNNVFITGFNEWIAQKKCDSTGQVFFVDTFDEQYSRDIEMYRDGYGDNFYLQLIENNRTFAFSEGNHYIYELNSIDINDKTLSGWENVKYEYKDFAGDAIERNFLSADQRTYLTDASARNDIVSTKVTHDNSSLYIKVETKEKLTERESSDKNYMNVFINTKKNGDNFMGFDFVLNRNLNGNQTSLERLKDNFVTEKVSDIDYSINENVIQFKVPLSLLGLDGNNCNISIKVTDNIQDEKDELDYYISGDCAPLGRLGYEYGY